MVFLLILSPMIHYSDHVFATTTNEPKETAGAEPEEDEDSHYDKMTDKNDLYSGPLTQSEQAYKSYKVEKKDFVWDEESDTMIHFPSATYITVPMDYNTVELVEFLVKEGDTVKKGQPVAKVKTSIDEVSYQEKTLELNRVQEVYNRFVKNQTAVLKDQKAALDKIKDKIDKKIAELEYEKAQFTFESSKRNQQEQIKSLQEIVNQSKAIKNTTEILASTDGYVYNVASMEPAAKFDYTTSLVTIVDTSKILFMLTDDSGLYQHDMKVTIKVNPSDTGAEKTFTGKVISSMIDYSKIKNNEEKPKYICYVQPDESINIEDVVDKKIRAVIHLYNMKDVLVIPTEAVDIEDSDSQDYISAKVLVLKDGALVERNCIPGISNRYECQIVAGIEEGEQIVIK